LHNLAELGYKLRTLRQTHGMSQAALGERCNVSQKEISHYETNYRTPPPDVVLRMAEVLGTTASELYGETITPKIDPDLKNRTVWLIAERLELLDESERNEVLRFIERKIAAKKGKAT
jgi:transcriptional regulator with XRE-family HTH domain